MMSSTPPADGLDVTPLPESLTKHGIDFLVDNARYNLRLEVYPLTQVFHYDEDNTPHPIYTINESVRQHPSDPAISKLVKWYERAENKDKLAHACLPQPDNDRKMLDSDYMIGKI